MPSRAPAHLIAAPTPTPRECAFATPHQHANEMHGNREKSLPIPQYVEIDNYCVYVVEPFDTCFACIISLDVDNKLTKKYI